MSTSISYSKNATIEDVLNEANHINHMTRQQFCAEPDNIEPVGSEARQEFFDIMVDEHRDFAQQYSLVLRYMIVYGMYNSGAFRRLLKRLRDNPPGLREDDYFWAMSRYCSDLHGIYYPQKNSADHRKACKRVEKEVFDELKNQSRRFWENARSAKESDDKRYREMLINHLRQFGTAGQTNTSSE